MQDIDVSVPVAATVRRRAPVVLKPFFGDVRAVEKNRQIAIQARNLGRTPVVDYEGGTPQITDRVYKGSTRIKNVSANESVVLPFINQTGALTMEVVNVTGMQPVKAGRRPRLRRLPFVSSRVLVPPP